MTLGSPSLVSIRENFNSQMHKGQNVISFLFFILTFYLEHLLCSALAVHHKRPVAAASLSQRRQ
jgi:hypothetical protein